MSLMDSSLNGSVILEISSYPVVQESFGCTHEYPPVGIFPSVVCFCDSPSLVHLMSLVKHKYPLTGTELVHFNSTGVALCSIPPTPSSTTSRFPYCPTASSRQEVYIFQENAKSSHFLCSYYPETSRSSQAGLWVRARCPCPPDPRTPPCSWDSLACKNLVPQGREGE